MSNFATKIDWEPLRSIDSTTFTGAYKAIGTPLINACYMIKMVNESGVDVIISNDGIIDKDICTAGGFWLYDEGANASREGGLAVQKGTQFYVKAGASVGKVYLVAKFIED